MSDQPDVHDLLNFLLEYATTLMGVGVHTSRIVRNTSSYCFPFWICDGHYHFSEDDYYEYSQ